MISKLILLLMVFAVLFSACAANVPAETDPTETVCPTVPAESTEPTVVTEPTTETTEPTVEPTEPTTEPAPTHDYTDRVEKEPTCAEPGLRVYTCTECGDTYDEEIEPLPHTYGKGKTTKPTCTVNGYTTYTCTVCEYSYQGNIVQAPGHEWGDWVLRRQPNPKVEGYQTRTCGKCKGVETVVIPKLPDNSNCYYGYENYVPTEDNAGIVSVTPYCVWWQDGKLVVQLFVVNDTDQDIVLDSWDVLTIYNDSQKLASRENIDMTGVTVSARYYEMLQIVFTQDLHGYGSSLKNIYLDYELDYHR